MSELQAADICTRHNQHNTSGCHQERNDRHYPEGLIQGKRDWRTRPYESPGGCPRLTTRIQHLSELLGDRAYLCLTLRNVHSGSESAENSVLLTVAIAQRFVATIDQWLNARGQPKCRHCDTCTDEIARCNPDHR